MTRQELAANSEAYIRQLFRKHLGSQGKVYLYGSRARHDNRWNSDYDFWIDADVPHEVIGEITDQLEESFVPFKVDIVTQSQLRGNFAEQAKKEAVRWM